MPRANEATNTGAMVPPGKTWMRSMPWRTKASATASAPIRATLVASLAKVQTSVDIERVPGDVRGAGGEEDRRGGHLIGAANAAEGDLRELVEARGRCDLLTCHVRIDEARGDAVDSDLGSQQARERARERDRARLGGRVVGGQRTAQLAAGGGDVEDAPVV